MPRVEHHVVPREHPRPSCGLGRFRQDGLFERRGGAAIATHAVERSNECQRQQCRQVSRRGQSHISKRHQAREGDERSPAPKAVPAKAHQRGGDGSAGETRSDHEASGRDRHAVRTEVNSEHDSDDADRRRTQKRYDTDQRCVATHVRLAPGQRLYTPTRRACSIT